jgi:hypothetical protein
MKTGKLTWSEVQALTLPVNPYVKQGFSSQTLHNLHIRPEVWSVLNVEEKWRVMNQNK